MSRFKTNLLMPLMALFNLIILTTACNINASTTDDSTAKSGLSYFAFHVEDNSQLDATVSGRIDGGNIYITVPYETDVKSLVPTINFGGATITPASGIAQDFTKPVTYTLQVDDSAKLYYTVFVSVALSDSKDILSFAFMQADNSDLDKNYFCQISEDRITAVFPKSVDLSSLVPTISISGKSINPRKEYPKDFRFPVNYTVIAADGSTKDYIVDLSTEKSDSKEIQNFDFFKFNNNNLIADEIGQIDGYNITVNISYYVDVTKLVPQIGFIGKTTDPLSGVMQDFTNPVEYSVIAEDGSRETYTVTVNRGKNKAKEIISFVFKASNNDNFILPSDDEKFGEDIEASIIGDKIRAVIPYSADLRSLIPTIEHNGESIRLLGDDSYDIKNPTALDFTRDQYGAYQVNFRVKAEDGSESTYTVELTSQNSPEKEIEIFGFYRLNNPELADDYIGKITGNFIIVEVPYGTIMKDLVPHVEYKGKISPANDAAQDFSSAVNYKLTAEDGTTRTYTVQVVQKNIKPEFKSFIFTKDLNSGLVSDIAGNIGEDSVEVKLPYSENSANFWLRPYIVSSADSVKPASGTMQNFASPVEYTLSLNNGETKKYSVNLSQSAKTDKEILFFVFEKAHNPDLKYDIKAEITGTNISAEIPLGVSLDGLVPTVGFAGESMTPASGVAASFNSPAEFEVFSGEYYEAQANGDSTDGLSTVYSVDLTEQKNNFKEITSFRFLKDDNSEYITQDYAGEIDNDNKLISFTLPYGTGLANLKPSISFLGMSLEIVGMEGELYESAMDFSAPIKYQVNAEDGSFETYTVVVNTFIPDRNVTLDSLMIRKKDDTANLVTGFNFNKLYYRVGLDAPEFVLNAVPYNSRVIMKINGVRYTSGTDYEITPTTCNSTLDIEISTEDGVFKNHYTIELYSLAKLSLLSLKTEGESEELLTGFDGDKHNYKLNMIENRNLFLTFFTYFDEIVRINGTLYTKGSEYIFNLDNSDKVIYIEVTNGDIVSKQYIINIEYDINPPAEVSNIIVEPRNKGFYIHWNNPLDSDLSKIRIVIKNVNSYFILANRETMNLIINGNEYYEIVNGIEYTITLYTIDYLGNISNGVSVVQTPSQEVWVKEFTSDSDGSDWIYSTVADNNGNIYIAGCAQNLISENSGFDWWIKKIDRFGNEINSNWDKMFDGNNGDDRIYAMTIDNAGSLYIAGSGFNLISSNSDHDWWIKKFSEDGNEIWDKRIDGNGRNDVINAIIVDKDNNVYVGGYGTGLLVDTYSKNWWIKKFDKNGIEDIKWDKKIQCEDLDGNQYLNGNDRIYDLAIDSEGNLYVAGDAANIVSQNSNSDGWIKKFDKYGNEVIENWNKKLGYMSSGECIRKIRIDSNDNIFALGYLDEGIYVKKYDKYGIEDTINWNKNIEHSDDSDSIGSIIIDKNNNLFICGYGYEYSYWIKKFTNDGIEDITNWDKRGEINIVSSISSIVQDTLGQIYISGTSRKSASNYDWWIMKFDE